jgi:hypothetical protein
MSKSENVSEASMEPIVSTRFVWVFEKMERHADRVWQFVEYFMTEYLTEDESEAVAIAKHEYGYVVRSAKRRKLTCEEYCAILRCNNEGEHNQKEWQAMLRIVFTGSISSC